MPQTYMALIAYLLICYHKFLCYYIVALQKLMRIFYLNLFSLNAVDLREISCYNLT